VGEDFADEDVSGDGVSPDDPGDVNGVNDGLRLRGVKIDSRSCPVPSVLGSSFAEGLASVTDDDTEDGEDDALFGFPIRSAGSGGTPPFTGSSLLLSPAPLALPLAAAVAGAELEAEAEAAAAEELPLSSGVDDDPFRDAALSADPDCEPPALVRDDDMIPLSVTVSSVSTSGSVSRTGGAIMNGVRVVGPASSTPSSSVLTVPLRTFA
jgi:hypothetical protein